MEATGLIFRPGFLPGRARRAGRRLGLKGDFFNEISHCSPQASDRRKRRAIRDALASTGLAARMEALVGRLLDG